MRTTKNKTQTSKSAFNTEVKHNSHNICIPIYTKFSCAINSFTHIVICPNVSFFVEVIIFLKNHSLSMYSLEKV